MHIRCVLGRQCRLLNNNELAIAITTMSLHVRVILALAAIVLIISVGFISITSSALPATMVVYLMLAQLIGAAALIHSVT